MVGVLLAVGLLVGLMVPAPAAADKPRPTYGFTMSGDEVVPGPGAPNGSASASLTVWFNKPYFVCAGVGVVEGAERPFTAELHRAPAGEAGPVVATLEFGSFGSACGDVNDKKVLQDIERNPHLYYFDIHTDEFPDGALRGQLA